jgi:hypothetical protein
VPKPTKRTFRPFGVSLSVLADDQRVFNACGAALDRMDRHVGVDGTFTLTCTTGHDGAADPAWPRTGTSWDGTTLDVRCGSGRLFVPGDGTAQLTLPPSLLAVPDAIRMFVEGAAWSFLIGSGRLHAVHSGLVETMGRGLLLRGASGAGKSTLTYAAMRAGFRVSSDDWVYGLAGRLPDRLWGYPWRMFLVAESIAHFPEVATITPVPHPGADPTKLPIEPPVARRRKSCSVDAVVFLDPSRESDIRRVWPDEARQRFWDPALPTERTDLPAEWVDELLDRPCFVLQRGTSPSDAVQLLQSVARSL